MIVRFNRDSPVQNLPDAYAKAGSNNEKILEIEKDAMTRLRDNIAAINNILDIENAYGQTLDLYGEMLGQARGAATDEQYRVMLRAKIIRNYSNADHDSVVYAICAAFGCDPNEILLTESANEPCVVNLENLPFTKLNSSNIDVGTAIQIIKRLMPAGVNLESMNFSGTFEFSGETLTYDAEKGFGDVDQTIGGYLGLASDGKDCTLPV